MSYTQKQLTARWGLCRRTLDRWRKTGKIQFERTPSGGIRFLEEVVREMERKHPHLYQEADCYYYPFGKEHKTVFHE